MKARDLKPGDTVDGWTVTDARPAGMWVSVGTEEWDAVVLLTLERELYLEGHDVNGEELWWAGKAPPGEGKTETYRTWYRADEGT
jgi:hypothetical protein